MSEETLKRNIELINRYYPEYIERIKIFENPSYSIARSKSGHLTINYGNMPIHSKYDPIREAQLTAQYENKEDHTMLIILGTGLAYHIDHILSDKSIKARFILIFELSDEIFSLATQFKKMDYLTDPRVVFNLGNELSDKTLSLIHTLDLKTITKLKLLNYNPLTRIQQDEYSQLECKILEEFKLAFQNQLTKLELSITWTKNILRNLATIKSAIDFTCFKNQFVNLPAIIASAGPSLNESLKVLQHYKDKCLIFAVDTALSVLIEHDIIPDFVVSLDCQFFNYRDFNSINCLEKINLLFDLSTYYKIPQYKFKNYIYFASSQGYQSSEYPILNYLQSAYGINIGKVIAGSSVTSSAIDIVRMMGCSPVMLLGQDMAYSKGMTHSIGSQYYRSMLYSSTKLNSFHSQTIKRIQARKVSFEISNNGEPVLSDSVLINLRDWLTYYFLLNKMNIFNCTENGLVIPSISFVHLENILSSLENVIIDKTMLIERILAKGQEENHSLDVFFQNFSSFLAQIFSKLSSLKEIDSIEEVSFLENIFNEEYYFMNNVIDNIFYKHNMKFFSENEDSRKYFYNLLIETIQKLRNITLKR